MDFEKKDIGPEKVAYINYTGNVEDMGMIIGKLTDWIVKNNINVVGAPFALYYTDPSMVSPDEMEYDVAIPVSGDLKEIDDIKIKEIQKHTVISGIHKGAYSNLPDTYMAIWNYIMENNFEANGVPKEIYLNDPDEVKEDELLTEIQFPIK